MEPKVRCRDHKSPSMDPDLSQMNPVHTLESFLNIPFNIIQSHPLKFYN